MMHFLKTPLLLGLSVALSSAHESFPFETDTRIPFEPTVVPFTPPPPPKEAPAMRVESQVVRPSAHGRTLTILRGEASTLPDLPEPLVMTGRLEPEDRVLETLPWETGGDHAFAERDAVRQIMLGATVYDGRISLVNWQDPETGRSHQALCGFDVGLFEGVGEFLHEGRLHSLFIMFSRMETGKLRRLPYGWSLPDFPVLEEDHILSLDEDTEAVDLSPLLKLRDVLKVERVKLEKMAAERAIYREESAAWHAANPEQARDHVIWFKPHRGSRYLGGTQNGAENTGAEGGGR